jgi:hypothetical protein
MKAPAFQFYVKDWLSDPQLRMASYQTKGIWIDMICYMWSAPERGIVTGTKDDICNLMHLSEEEFEKFLSDAQRLNFASVTLDNKKVTIENRRMVREEKAKKSNAVRQQRYRSNAQSNTKVTPPSSTASASAKKERVKKETRKQSLTDSEYFEVLKNNPAYKGIDIDREKAKCEAWCLTNNKLFSRRRLVNWLNRIERPMTIDRPPGYDGRPKPPSALEQMKAEDAQRGEPTEDDIRAAKELVKQLTGAL